MNDKEQLELLIETRDEDLISEVEAALGPVVRRRLPVSRVIDPQTILELAAGSAQLVTALLALRDRLLSRPDAPAVTVRNARTDEVDLVTASTSSIESLVTDPDAESA